VNKVDADFIGLLVLGVFNAAIARQNIRPQYSFRAAVRARSALPPAPAAAATCPPVQQLRPAAAVAAAASLCNVPGSRTLAAGLVRLLRARACGEACLSPGRRSAGWTAGTPRRGSARAPPSALS